MSRTIAVTMVKDEADIIAATVGHMAKHVDHVIVADNMSTDGTREILEGLDVEVIDDHEIGYWQSRKMTALARLAQDAGADWVLPFDADELWCCPIGRIADLLADHEPDFGIVTAELFDHVVTGADPTWGDVVTRLPWRRQHPLPLVKVACRAHPEMVIEQGNHWARYPIPPRPTETPRLTVHHFPYRSPEQFIRKVRNGARAYAETEGLAPDAGAHWRQWGTWADDELRELFRVWYYRTDPLATFEINGEPQTALVHDAPER